MLGCLAPPDRRADQRAVAGLRGKCDHRRAVDTQPSASKDATKRLGVEHVEGNGVFTESPACNATSSGKDRALKGIALGEESLRERVGRQRFRRLQRVVLRADRALLGYVATLERNAGDVVSRCHLRVRRTGALQAVAVAVAAAGGCADTTTRVPRRGAS